MGIFRLILYYLIFSYLWKTAAYAGRNGSIETLLFAIVGAFMVIVWPFPLNKPKPNGGNE